MVKSGDAMRGVPAFFFEGWESRSAMVGHSAGGGVGWEGEESASGICIIGTWYLIRFVSLGGGQT